MLLLLYLNTKTLNYNRVMQTFCKLDGRITPELLLYSHTHFKVSVASVNSFFRFGRRAHVFPFPGRRCGARGTRRAAAAPRAGGGMLRHLGELPNSSSSRGVGTQVIKTLLALPQISSRSAGIGAGQAPQLCAAADTPSG